MTASRACNYLQNAAATTYKKFLQFYAKRSCKKHSYTVIGDSMSAGRIYDKIGKKAKAKVVLVTGHGTICCISKKSLLDNKKKVKKSETEIEE